MFDLTSSGRLWPKDQIVLRDCLKEAFTTAPRFNEFLQFRLNCVFNNYYGMSDDYPEGIRRVVEQFNAEVHWRVLLREARNAVPDDPGLVAFAERFDQAPIAVEGAQGQGSKRLSEQELELRIKKANPISDILIWRRRLGEIEGRVCRIELPAGTARGTGFLVGPDVVMTNYHVIEKLQKGEIRSSELALRFDYKVLSDGITVSSGKTYRLADDWLIDSSPYSPMDQEVAPNSDPALDELDYALLRVDGKPAADPVGGDTDDPKPVARQWIPVPAMMPYDFNTNKALFIVQHPDGKPMQVAFDTEALISLNGNGTRVRYSTTTEPGSSGSPCFNADWEWVALHHSGDPRYYRLRTPAEFNEGIPLSAIIKQLHSRGLANVLGGGN